MELRRLQKFASVLGVTLPKKYTRELEMHWKDYVEVEMLDNDTLTIRKHKIK